MGIRVKLNFQECNCDALHADLYVPPLPLPLSGPASLPLPLPLSLPGPASLPLPLPLPLSLPGPASLPLPLPLPLSLPGPASLPLPLSLLLPLLQTQPKTLQYCWAPKNGAPKIYEARISPNTTYQCIHGDSTALHRL